MHIAPDNILVSGSIALLLSSWSFLFCYFLLRKIRPIFYALCIVVVLTNLYFVTWYLSGFVMLIGNTLASLAVGTIGSTIHFQLDKKWKIFKDSYFLLFVLHCVAAQLPTIVIANIYNFAFSPSLNSTVAFYLEAFYKNGWFLLLFYLGPSVSIIPLYMFKTYRPRPGMDTHFPDVENN